ncbi:hypothetical protein [Streptomyces sp. NPDC015125]|uniref:hypothetical protein n=1 Tax=Streptomyces sp. NPDC015125 TaxID=3364938 RepID=UPI0037013D36
MRMLRFLSQHPRPVALLAAGITVATLGLASVTHTYSGRNAGMTIGTPGCSVGIEWRGNPGTFASCTGTDPDAAAQPTPTAASDGAAPSSPPRARR